MSIGVGWGGRVFSDAAEGIEVFSREFKEAWDGQPRVVGNVVRRYLNRVMTDLARQHSGSYPSGTTADTLSKRTGALVGALTKKITVTGTTWSALKGAVNLPGGLAIHEYGGTIRGRGKMLAIPLPEALNSNGTPKRAGPREWDKTFVAMTKNQNLLIFQRRGAGIVPLYVLKDSVRIPARLRVGKSLRAGVSYFASQAADAVVKDVLKQMRG